MLKAKHLAGPAKTDLDFIEDKKQVVLVGEVTQPLKESFRRLIHAALALHRFNQYAASVLVDRFFDRINVAVLDRYETGCEWAETFLVFLAG